MNPIRSATLAFVRLGYCLYPRIIFSFLHNWIHRGLYIASIPRIIFSFLHNWIQRGLDIASIPSIIYSYLYTAAPSQQSNPVVYGYVDTDSDEFDNELLDYLHVNVYNPNIFEFKIFTCPYCDHPKLSISTLYDHVIVEHLDNESNVCCPICIYLGERRNVVTNMNLTRHIAVKHSTSLEQYTRNMETTGLTDNERLRFITSTMPPTSLQTPVYLTKTAKRQKLKKRDDEDSKCPICLGTFAYRVIRRLWCKHTFHNSCIKQWVNENNNCPMCRQTAEL